GIGTNRPYKLSPSSISSSVKPACRSVSSSGSSSTSTTTLSRWRAISSGSVSRTPRTMRPNFARDIRFISLCWGATGPSSTGRGCSRRSLMNPQVRGLLTILVFFTGVVVGGSAVFTWTSRQQLFPALPTVSSKDEPARVWEATVFVPVVDGEGRRFNEPDWQRALDILVADFGGATL